MCRARRYSSYWANSEDVDPSLFAKLGFGNEPVALAGESFVEIGPPATQESPGPHSPPDRLSCFDAVLASVGVEGIRTPVRSPKANAFAERFVGTVRRECLDHLVVVSRRQLQTLFGEYVHHYNQARPHRGLHLTQPVLGRVTPDTGGKVIRCDILGGIIHGYERAA